MATHVRIKAFESIAIAVVGLLYASSAQSTTLTFDGLPVGPLVPFTQEGYAVSWHGYPNGTYAQSIMNVGGSNQNVVVDGTPANVYGTALSITRIDGNPFDVISLDIANLSNGASNNDLRVGEEQPLGTPGPTYVSYYPSSSTFVTVNPGLEGVYSVYIDLITYGGTQHAADNVVLQVVPEPGAALLLGFGLCALGIRRRARSMAFVVPILLLVGVAADSAQANPYQWVGATTTTFTGDGNGFGFVGMTSQCRGEFGPGARMCTSVEILESDTHNLLDIPSTGCWIRPVFQPFGGNLSTTGAKALDASGLLADPNELTCLWWTGGLSAYRGLVLGDSGSFARLSCDVPRSVACCKPTAVPEPSAALSVPVGAAWLIGLATFRGNG